MSPRIEIGNRLILDQEDESRSYPIGAETLTVDLSLLSPNNPVNVVRLSGLEALRGEPGKKTANGVRELELNKKGEGSQKLSGGEKVLFKLKNERLVRNPPKPWTRRLFQHR